MKDVLTPRTHYLLGLQPACLGPFDDGVEIVGEPTTTRVSEATCLRCLHAANHVLALLAVVLESEAFQVWKAARKATAGYARDIEATEEQGEPS